MTFNGSVVGLRAFFAGLGCYLGGGIFSEL